LIAVNAAHVYKSVILAQAEWQVMSSQTFYASSTRSKRIQPSPHHHPRVHLSKEARTLLTVSCREKSCRFKTALDDAWSQIDECVKTIASSNSKTIRCVQHDLYMGQRLLRSKHSKLSVVERVLLEEESDRGQRKQYIFFVSISSTLDLLYAAGSSGKAILWDLVQDNHAEYHELSDNAKASLLKEYEEHKAMKTTGTHISTKLKVNDITQTLKAIENEVCDLFYFI
jgi:hypothetical protein